MDTLAYQVEKESKEWADKVPADVKTRLDSAVERARKAHRGEDMNEIKAALEELTAAFQAAGQAVYAAQSAPAADASTPGAEAPAGDAKKDDVAEADFEIVDEAKKE